MSVLGSISTKFESQLHRVSMKFVKARCIDVCILGGKSLKTNVVLGVYRPNLSISCLHNTFQNKGSFVLGGYMPALRIVTRGGVSKKYFKDGPLFRRSQCHIHIHYRVQQHHHIEGNVINRPVM